MRQRERRPRLDPFQHVARDRIRPGQPAADATIAYPGMTRQSLVREIGGVQGGSETGAVNPDRSTGKCTMNENSSTRAKRFLAAIVDDTPEDRARIWFENAPPEVRLAAFIRLDVELSLIHI